MRKRILTAVLGLALLAGQASSQTLPASLPASLPATASAPTHRVRVTTQPTLQGAQWCYWHGHYEQAIELYRSLAAQPASAVEAAIGLADACAAVGKYQDALAALQAVAARGASQADWQVALAGALANVGQYDQAIQAARKALQLRDDWGPAIYTCGSLLEQVGQKEQAKQVYKTSEKIFLKKDFGQDCAELVAAGKILDRYAVLAAQKASRQAQNVLQNYFQKAYQQVDKDYWPANLAAATLLLERHKPALALEECRLIDRVNPNHPDVSVIRGVLALGEMNFEKALQLADRALAVNPNHADALLLKAACYMLWRKYDQAPPLLEKILAFNPNHLEALATLAAVCNRLGQPQESEKFIQRVLKIDPDNSLVYQTLGQWLSAARQYTEAEKFLKKAIELAPEQAGPVTELGLLYMQTGQEDLAQETLKKAFELDDYRGDVDNYLKLLDKLAKFKTRETEHFVIKVDQRDEVLLDYLAEQAEAIHADISKHFGYTPPQKTIVEVFPDHEAFSVRLTGRGWLPTVGACTGRVIAMPAPDPLRNGGAGSFNWAVVLRHEYTHAVTLAMTENRIPHWFTEACAVWEQDDRRNFEAVNLLVGAVRAGKLFAVKDLDWGFIRPRTPADRPQAYAHAEWIFEYVVEKKGFDAIVAMLQGFKDNLTQEEVFQKCLGVGQEQFDKDFLAWARQQVSGWGFDSDPNPDLAAAQRVVNERPGDDAAQATLAMALARQGQAAQTEAAARKALAINPQNRRALHYLAWALMNQQKEKDALDAALALQAQEPDSWLAARIMAESYLNKRQWAQAIGALENYKRRLQYDPYAYEKLAGLYMQLGQKEAALPNLIELHRRTMKDPKYARQVADIYRATGQAENALKYYDDVIHINPYDVTAYTNMAGLYLGDKQYDKALRAVHAVALLEPDKADSWTQTALVCYRVYKAQKTPALAQQARSAIEKALQLDPNSPRAGEILALLNEELPPASQPAESPQ
jgi:tetratricopeptide (TPR) repeat protein